MTLTNDQIQALQAMADKATPGPWDTHTGNVIRAIKGDFAVPIFESRAPFEWHKNKRLTDAVMLRAYADEHNNAAFIAATREAVPALCAEVLALRADNERLNGIITSAVPNDYLPIDTPHEFVAAVEVNRLRAEVARLREALGPFANMTFDVLDFGRARAVMEGM